MKRKRLSPSAMLRFAVAAYLMLSGVSLCAQAATEGSAESQSGSAAAQSGSAADTAVRALVGRYAQARENESADAIRLLFVETADQLVSSGEWRRGREALVAGMMASSRGNPGDRSIEVQSVRLLSDTVALADARYEIAASANRPARRMWSTFIAVRTNNVWKIAAIRNMLPAQ